MLQNRQRGRKRVVAIVELVSSTTCGFLNLPILRLAGYLSVGRIENRISADRFSESQYDFDNRSSHQTSYTSVSQTFTSSLTHYEYGKQSKHRANGGLFVDYTNESEPFHDNLGEAWTVLCFDLAGSQAFPLLSSRKLTA